MSTYFESCGVRTWYNRRGTGESLVMLHPSGADSRAFEPNLATLTSHFTVLLPERRGHGRTPDVDGPCTFDTLAEDTIRFIEHVVGGPTMLMGMSAGAVTALLVAMKRPDLVKRLVFVAGVFHHSGWADGVDLDALNSSGPTLTGRDLGDVRCRTLAMFGDDDEVRPEHMLDFYQGVPRCELAVVPGTSHGLLVEKTELCNRIMLDFLTQDPPRTLAPRRRAEDSAVGE